MKRAQEVKETQPDRLEGQAGRSSDGAGPGWGVSFLFLLSWIREVGHEARYQVARAYGEGEVAERSAKWVSVPHGELPHHLGLDCADGLQEHHLCSLQWS